MTNTGITIKTKSNVVLRTYISDIIPLVGDYVDVQGSLHKVMKRIFITEKNRVVLIVTGKTNEL